MKMRRREFLWTAGAFAAGGCRLPGAAGGDYDVTILGDTHFDETEWGTYHVGWKPRDDRDAGGRRREFARDAAMWKERLPSLIAAAAKCHRPMDAFLLQVGDLVQGDTANAEMELKMYRDALCAVRRGMEELPFLTVAGNHDVRNGGRPVYDSFFPPYLSKEFGRKFDSTTFHFTQGPDAWIVADFMQPDAARLFAALDETEGCRHTFIVCHSPLTPSDNWGFFWFLFGKNEDTALRRRFLARILKRHVIVLCWHLHYTELEEWRRDGGLLTQFSFNSVWGRPEQSTPELLASDPKKWGELYVHKNATDKPEEHDGHYTNRSRAESLALMDEYAPGLVRYEKYDAAGHYRLHVSDAAVTVDFYPGDALVPERTFVLRG